MLNQSNDEIEIIITENESGTRLDCFLSEMFSDVSRSKIQEMIADGRVLINNKETKNGYKLRIGDRVFIKREEREEIDKIEPQNIPLDIKYEDEDMLVVNKPFGMLTHPTAFEKKDTLVNALLYYTKGNLSDFNGEERPGILHRLDRNTSGLLMIAKNNEAHAFLSEQIKNKTAVRKYVAVVRGNIKTDEGIIDKPIGRHPKNVTKMAISEDGKSSVTHYKVLERFKGYTFLELRLETGRTHQIRVHLSSEGYPIFGDSVYGDKKACVKTHEQVLQAYFLCFTNFRKREIIRIEISYDEDVDKVLKYLRGNN